MVDIPYHGTQKMTKITLTNNAIFCDGKHPKCEAADKNGNTGTLTKVCFLVLDSGIALFPLYYSTEGRNNSGAHRAWHSSVFAHFRCLGCCGHPLMIKSKSACWTWDRLDRHVLKPYLDQQPPADLAASPSHINEPKQNQTALIHPGHVVSLWNHGQSRWYFKHSDKFWNVLWLDIGFNLSLTSHMLKSSSLV